MIDAQSSNATATFYRETEPEEGEDWDPYDDTESDLWEPVYEDIGVLYEPRGSTFVTEGSGDRAHREERIFAPLGVDDELTESQRVDVEYRGRTYKRRVSEPQPRSFDGFQGYCEIELVDMSD